MNYPLVIYKHLVNIYDEYNNKGNNHTWDIVLFNCRKVYQQYSKKKQKRNRKLKHTSKNHSSVSI